MMRLDGRRLVRAVLLTGLAFLLVGGGVGFVMAVGAADGPLLVPAPRPGDRATYAVGVEAIADLRGADVDIRLDEVVYEWLPERMVLDEGFMPRPSQTLQSTFVYRADGNESRYTKLADHDTWTGEPFHTTASGFQMIPQELLAHTDGGLGYGVDTVLEPALRVEFLSDYYGWLMGPPCAQRTLLHGSAPTAVPRELRLGTCGWMDDRAPVFVAAGWEQLPTGRAFRFDAAEQPLLHVWYETGSPFPVRFTTALGDGIDPSLSDGRLFTLERTAWARGAEEYPRHEPPEGTSRAVPIVPLVPGRRLDDEGLGGELPLSRAYAAAEIAPRSTARQGFGAFALGSTQPSVAEWLAAHPSGYLADASRSESTDWYGQTNPSWRLLWVDGDDWLGKMVSWEPSHEDPFSAHFPDVAGRRLVVMDYYPASTEQMPAKLATYPAHPEDVALPFATEVAARYLESAPGASITNYGFRYLCADDCTTATSYVYAGETVSTIDPKFSAAGGTSTFVSLVVDDEGRALQRYTQVTEPQTVLGLGAPTPDETPTAQGPSLASVWDLPDTRAAATGISLVAVLAGALYYFWPAVKGATGLGLFSRIEDGKVLEHPTRRRIHDAIASEPGIHFQALSRKADIGRGALEHHLRKLAAAGIVTVRRAPGFTCYFLKGTIDRHLLHAAPALRTEGSRAVLQAVAANPGASSRDLAAALGISPSTASYHLKRLELAGLVAPGEKSGVRVTPLGSQAAA